MHGKTSTSINAAGYPVVLHVAESFGGGVAGAIVSYVSNTPEFEHELLYATHTDAPVSDDLLRPFARVVELPPGHGARIAEIRRRIRGSKASVVHAHSSWAGAYVRLAVRRSRDLAIVYTPHCYAFERRDIGPLARAFYRAAEWSLSFNTTSFAACGEHEAKLSRWSGSRATVTVVPNAASGATPEGGAISPPEHGAFGSEPVLMGAGRLRAQKDPTFFAAAVRALRLSGEKFRAVWVGDGEARYRDVLRREDIAVTGWLDPDLSRRTLNSATAYLHTAMWEGFPLSVLEAAASDIPVIARDIPALRDEGVGHLISMPEQVVAEWRSLRTPTGHAAAIAAEHRLLSQHGADSQAARLRLVYGSAIPSRSETPDRRVPMDRSGRYVSEVGGADRV